MKHFKLTLLTALILALGLVFTAEAYWIWTPATGKFVNPKHAVKETPQEQFDWAKSFLDSRDYKRAIVEFEKLIKNYPLSKLASQAQFHIAQSYEETTQYYQAFENYQLVIDKYPYSEQVDEIIKRQYSIGNLFYSGQKAKLFGMSVLPAKDKAVAIFIKVVENAPYGEYADIAQFKLGQCYMDLKDYVNAALAFKEIIENYPKSPLIDDAKYQIALCAANAATGPEYNEEDTEQAISEFKDFVKRYPDSQMEKEARSFINELEEQSASKDFEIARFYERREQFNSAIIYYEEVLIKYPKSEWAVKALEKAQILRQKVKQGK